MKNRGEYCRLSFFNWQNVFNTTNTQLNTKKLTIFLLILASKFGENRIEVSNLTDILFFAYKVFSASLEIEPLCTDISAMEYISSPQHAWPKYAYMVYYSGIYRASNSAFILGKKSITTLCAKDSGKPVAQCILDNFKHVTSKSFSQRLFFPNMS